MYEIETRKHEPKNLFAGDFPTLPETGVAGAAIEECMPVAKNADGKIVPVEAPAEGETMEVVGIAAAAAEAEEKRLEEEQRRAENLAAQEEALSEEEDRIAREAMEDQESGDASIWIDSNP